MEENILILDNAIVSQALQHLGFFERVVCLFDAPAQDLLDDKRLVIINTPCLLCKHIRMCVRLCRTTFVRLCLTT